MSEVENESQAPLKTIVVPALVLEVEHREMIDAGQAEPGAPFRLVWENKKLFPTEEARNLFVKTFRLVETIEGGYDYAVYRTTIENRPVLLGPGDAIVIHSDKSITAVIGGARVKLVDDHPQLSSLVTLSRD